MVGVDPTFKKKKHGTYVGKCEKKNQHKTAFISLGKNTQVIFIHVVRDLKEIFCTSGSKQPALSVYLIV